MISKRIKKIIGSQMSLKEKASPRKADDFFQQCYQNVPPRIKSSSKVDRSQIPVDISADDVNWVCR